jgi:hypothetical protein
MSEDVVAEVRKALESVANDFKTAVEKLAEDAEYRIDKEIGRQLAKNPELYADLKKGYRDTRKFFDGVAGDLGLK